VTTRHSAQRRDLIARGGRPASLAEQDDHAARKACRVRDLAARAVLAADRADAPRPP